MKIGFIGLGKMGSRMVIKLIEEEHEVVVWNRSPEPIEDIKNKIENRKNTYKKLKIAKTIEELVQSLDKSRVVWSMVPAGEATETVLKEVSRHVQKDDIVIDGGNAFYKDTEKRYQNFKKRVLNFWESGFQAE